MDEYDPEPVGDEEKIRELAAEVFPDYTGVDESSTVWISLTVELYDHDGSIDGGQLETDLYRFIQEFLEKRLYNYGADDLSEMVDMEPAQSGEWSDNELIVRYEPSVYDAHMDKPKRQVSAYFPTTDGLSWKDLKRFQDRFEDILAEIDPAGYGKEYKTYPVSVYASGQKVSEINEMMDNW